MPARALGDAGRAGGSDLLRREGAIGGSETQRKGKRPVAFGHLRSDVHVEEADLLAQVPRPLANRVGDSTDGHGFGNNECDVFLGDRLGYHVGCRGDVRRCRDERVEIEFERAGARGQGVRRDDTRVQLPRMADDMVAHD